MIQQKINNGEGLLVIDIDGVETEILASELNQKTDPQWNKTIDDYKTEIELYKKEYGNDPEKYEEKMIEISEDLIATRKAQNPDYKLWQSYPIITKYTKHDYMPIGNESEPLMLKTSEYRTQEFKDKKKKEVAEILIAKYPEKQIKGELASILTGLESEIDLIDNEIEIKNYQIDFSVIE